MIIGTAGHIDHGKSALVEALTGASMDPLVEERRRGITLDLHFAPFRLADGRVAGVIDVPGHEDLIRTMVAGAAGLDLVLLIVAADEGIMPQTREHLAIVEQLGIPAGIPVITKRDLVDAEWLALVSAEVAAWLDRSPVRFTPPVAVSATRGEGLEELRALLQEAAGRERPRHPNDLFRLPVDRAFSLAGVGTVVTGTAWSGRLRVGDAVRLLPGAAEGRVRSLEHHGTAVEESLPGQRTAVGIAGLDRGAVGRGHVLLRREDPWQETTALDVALELLATLDRPLAHHVRVRVGLGTDEVLARVATGTQVEAGEKALVRLSLERSVVARGGDRFVLRSYSPVTTIGGGWIVDPQPPRGRPVWPPGIAEPDPALRLRALAERRATGLEAAQVPLLAGVVPDEFDRLVDASGLLRAGPMLLTPAAVASAESRAREILRAYHSAHPSEPGMPLETLRQSLGRWGAASELALERLGAGPEPAVTDGAVIRLSSFTAAAKSGAALVLRLVQRIEAAGLAPPSLAELEAEFGTPGIPEALRVASQTGGLVAVERDRFFGATALAGFRAQVLRLGLQGPITLQALRDATGLSRKFLIPLLEWSDRDGTTVREGDARRLTPRGRAESVGG